MASPFAFINVQQGSPAANKSLALRHVMRGKNIGKTHPHRRRRRDSQGEHGDSTVEKAPGGAAQSRKRHRSSRSTPIHSQAEDGQGRLVGADQDEASISPVTVGDTLVGFATPAELSASVCSVFEHFITTAIHRIYPTSLCITMEPMKRYWIEASLSTKPGYHTHMAVMTTLYSYATQPLTHPFTPTPSRETAYHLGQAISEVNQRLSTPSLLTECDLFIVNFLVLQCLILKQRHDAEVHLAGLRAMVKLRGGLESVSDEFVLGKICKTELDYALHYGTKISFLRDNMAQIFDELGRQGFHFPMTLGTSSDMDDTTRWASKLDPALRQILFDLKNVASLFNDADGHDASGPGGGKREKKQPSVTYIMIQDITISAGGRLIRWHPLGQAYIFGSFEPLDNRDDTESTCPLPARNKAGARTKSPLEAAIHIALVCLVTTLFVQMDQRRSYKLKYDIAARRLREVVDAVMAPSIRSSGVAIHTDTTVACGRGAPTRLAAGVLINSATVVEESVVASSMPETEGVLDITTTMSSCDRIGSTEVVASAARRHESDVCGWRDIDEADSAVWDRHTELASLNVACNRHNQQHRFGAVESECCRVLDDEVLLWLLMVGSVSVLSSHETKDDNDASWLAHRVRIIAGRLGLFKWESAQERVMKKFPWIRRLFNDNGRKRWENIFGPSQV